MGVWIRLSVRLSVRVRMRSRGVGLRGVAGVSGCCSSGDGKDVFGIPVHRRM